MCGRIIINPRFTYIPTSTLKREMSSVNVQKQRLCEQSRKCLGREFVVLTAEPVNAATSRPIPLFYEVAL